VTLSLDSDSGPFAGNAGFCRRFREENIGRLLRSGGEELCGAGKDGGVDVGASSENIAADCLGLDDGSLGSSCVGVRLLRNGNGVAVSARSAELCCVVVSTRLRFNGGS
jgi:hypothetical protein